MKLTVIALMFLLVISCGSEPQEVEDSYKRSEFFVVDYEDMLGKKEKVYLSDLAADVEYIRLETTDDCLLCLKPDFYFTDEYIFVNNSKHILQFDRQGSFIKQIGKYGRGPGEIGLIRQLTVLDDEKLLIVQTNWARKLYYFNYDGELVRQENIQNVYRIVGLPGGSLLSFDYCIDGKKDYLFVITDSQGDTSDVVRNHYKWENTSGYGATISYDIFRPFYKYGDTTYCKSRHNDTVYQAVGGSIIPAYYINMGKYLLPQEYRIEALNTSPKTRMQDFEELSKGYRMVSAMEANENLFISSKDYSPFRNNDVQFNMIYNRPGHAGSLLVDDTGFSSGIINDFDGGVDFWPIGTVNDSTLFMRLLPHEILNIEVPEDRMEAEELSPEKVSSLMDLINGVKEDDNPVLMLVHLR